MQVVYGKVEDAPIKVSSLYFHPYYAKAVEGVDEGEAWYFYITDGNRFCYYNFIKRKIYSFKDKDIYDITTPFDYGGYLYNDWSIMPHFFEYFDLFAKKHSIVSEFIRFLPSKEWEVEKLGVYLEIQKVNDLIYMDLTQEFVREYSRGRRSNINKIEKLDYVVDAISIEQFYILYKETMKDNQAHDYFYFSQNILEELIALKFSRLLGIYIHDELLSAMMIHDDKNISYYFLGASSTTKRLIHANAMLFHEVALLLKKEGQQKFFLGGGREGVYDFKRRFSKLTVPYYIGKKIHNEALYQQLVTSTGREENSFFPKYREKVI